MPYAHEHAARMTDPGKYQSFARKNMTPGIDVIYGIKDGKSEIQAYRFAKEKFTVAEAKAWLKEHDLNPILFEAAASTKNDSVITGRVDRTTYFSF